MRQLRTLVAGVAVAGSLAAPMDRTNAANVASPSATPLHDPCAARLPLDDFASGLQFSTLHAGRFTLILGQYGRQGMRTLLRGFHATPVPGDTVEQIELTLTLPGRKHLYTGLVHAFTHGSTQHVCVNQPLYVDYCNSAYCIAHPHTTMVRMDGVITVTPQADGFVRMGQARFTIQIGTADYSLWGRFQSV
jgi:hypothetical protein